MSNRNIINKIARGFGIVFIVFAVIAAALNYELYSIEYGSSAPASFLQVQAVTSMIIFLLFAALSFIVAWATRQPPQDAPHQEMPSAMTEKTETRKEDHEEDNESEENEP
jgi:flagellar biosynthesis component FlhA